MRKFIYYAEPEAIRSYLGLLGYQTEDDYSRDGREVVGFRVVGTYVRLSYDIVQAVRVVGCGLITLHESVLVPDPEKPRLSSIVESDPEIYKTSRNLYQRLYRRFRKPDPSDRLQWRKWLDQFATDRAFQYFIEPSAMISGLVQEGYEPHEYFDYEGREPIGVDLLNGRVRVSFGRTLDGQTIAPSTVCLCVPPGNRSPDSQSLALYEELYGRYYQAWIAVREP